MGISAALGSANMTPVGIVNPFAGSIAPAGWLLCGGQAVSRSSFAGLFAVIGTTYGTGDGSTTFNVPDMRGRTIAGLDNMGGSAASRLTSTTITGGAETLGNNGGAQTHTLASGESGVPAHGHTASSGNDSPDHTHGTYGGTFSGSYPYTSGWNTAGAVRTSDGASNRHTHSITVNNNTAANAGSAHNNTQPTIVLNYIIKAA